MKEILLEKGRYYHIYNKALFGENLFRENDNYRHFLRLYEKYIEPIADTYAWVLMKNHFHLLVKINNVDFPKPVYQYFSNLFNAYTKAYNNRYNRNGPLFVRPFKRHEVNSLNYLKNLIYYIHYNPVHHGFTTELFDYPWSSYLSLVSFKETKLKRGEIMGWFNNKNEFVEYHQNATNIHQIEEIAGGEFRGDVWKI